VGKAYDFLMADICFGSMLNVICSKKVVLLRAEIGDSHKMTRHHGWVVAVYGLCQASKRCSSIMIVVHPLIKQTLHI
jgi:hypothetical protein